jgi:hypothetical protein
MKDIKSQFVNYDKVIDLIGEKRIEERLDAIKEVYIDFLDKTGYQNGDDIILNERVLLHVILDYFTDITRLKEFHQIERVNKDKIFSYEISWFLKRKPIQVLKNDREELVYVNEKFILGILVNHLTEGKIDDFSGNNILVSFCDILLYYLKYRDCEPKVLEMLIMSFKAGNGIPKIKYTK